jgi:multisubunit Na+/H+ antiporter MnhB subunit
MRYFIQFLIPAIILVAVVYLLGRNRRASGEDEDRGRETATFILILVVGASVAVMSFFALEAFLT